MSRSVSQPGVFRPGRPTPPTGETEDARPHALHDLSEATRLSPARGLHGRADRRTLSVVFSCLVAAVAGTALIFAGDLEYRCTAVLQWTGAPADRPVGMRDVLRGRLAAVLSGYFAARPDRPPISSSIETPAADLLRVNVVTPDRERGLADVRRIAESFIASVETSARLPAQRERWLEDRLAELKTRLDDAEAKVIESISNTPFVNPETRRTELLRQWHAQRDGFEDGGRRLRDAAAALRALRESPVPTRAAVSGNRRRAALLADEALQQDLAQLRVELSDLKHALLDGWQRAAPLVEDLVRASDAFQAATEAALKQSNDPAIQAHIEHVQLDAEAYARRLATFSRTWNGRFTTLRTLPPEPLTPDVFDALEHIESDQGDFFFQAGKSLSAMQNRIRAFAGTGVARARTNMLESGLIRAFEVLRQAHDRVSLVASDRRPVRVDAALRGSRRLDRRARERVSGIDGRLAAEALERARADRLAAIDRAARALETIRARHDALADDLIRLQEELNVTSDLTAAFLRDSLRTEFASLHLQTLARSVDQTERELNALTDERATAGRTGTLRLRQVRAGDVPTNLRDRLRIGAIGAALALGVSLLSQWRSLRRRRDREWDPA